MIFLNVLSRKRTLTLLSGFILTSSSLLDAHSLPVPVGPPIIMSPDPATNPDPVLQNLQTVMNNFYQAPFFPTPDDLSGIYYISNLYLAPSVRFSFNPLNDRIVHHTVAQNWIFDQTGTTLFPGIASNTFTTSFDGGNSWSFGPPIVQIIPLGGSISQQINASMGPGLFFEYDKNGRLNASGWGFMDLVANPPNTVPTTGFLFTHSDNNAKTWAPPEIVLTTDIAFALFGTGLGPREFYTTTDIQNPDLIHASTMNQIWFQNFTNVFYFRSENAGKTFSQPRQAYTMVNDPVWQAQHFDPAFTSNLNYYLFGGLSLSSSHPVIYDKNTLLLPIFRAYPKVGSKTYRLFNPFVPLDTNFDQAIVKSRDGGKTWSKIAGATEQFISPIGIFDPGFIDPSVPQLVNGVLTLGYLFDDTGQGTSPLISPLTGRLYLTYSANNPASSSDYAMQTPYVLLSASSDQGSTFSKAVQINATPTNIPFRAQQAFSGTATFTTNGYYVVAYYDFRNWTGFPGEDVTTTTLPTDAWIAVYKETEDPRGGSTRVGLDYVGEIRLTPESFNGRNISLGTSVPYLANFATAHLEGIPIAVNKNNEIFVGYSMTHPGSLSNITIGFKGMTIDTNLYITLYLQRFKFANETNE